MERAKIWNKLAFCLLNFYEKKTEVLGIQDEFYHVNQISYAVRLLAIQNETGVHYRGISTSSMRQMGMSETRSTVQTTLSLASAISTGSGRTPADPTLTGVSLFPSPVEQTHSMSHPSAPTQDQIDARFISQSLPSAPTQHQIDTRSIPQSLHSAHTQGRLGGRGRIEPPRSVSLPPLPSSPTQSRDDSGRGGTGARRYIPSPDAQDNEHGTDRRDDDIREAEENIAILERAVYLYTTNRSSYTNYVIPVMHDLENCTDPLTFINNAARKIQCIKENAPVNTELIILSNDTEYDFLKSFVEIHHGYVDRKGDSVDLSIAIYALYNAKVEYG